MPSDAPPEAPSTVHALNEALATMRAEHAKLEAMIESVPDFVCGLTPEGVFQYVNRVVPGMTSDQVLGHTIFEFADPAAHPIIRDTIARVLSTREPATYESLAVGVQGPQTPYLTRIRPVIKDGQVVALTVVATDISELQRATRRLDDQRNRTELAAEAAGVPPALIGPTHVDGACADRAGTSARRHRGPAHRRTARCTKRRGTRRQRGLWRAAHRVRPEIALSLQQVDLVRDGFDIAMRVAVRGQLPRRH